MVLAMLLVRVFIMLLPLQRQKMAVMMMLEFIHGCDAEHEHHRR